MNASYFLFKFKVQGHLEVIVCVENCTFGFVNMMSRVLLDALIQNSQVFALGQGQGWNEIWVIKSQCQPSGSVIIVFRAVKALIFLTH